MRRIALWRAVLVAGLCSGLSVGRDSMVEGDKLWSEETQNNDETLHGWRFAVCIDDAVDGAATPPTCLITTNAIAQQQSAAIASNAEFPDAPSAVLDQQSSSEQAAPR